ncbi:Hypothetical predicted protein [Cloeon dipterum]|uniref:Uncharacterized protein n=1 Tax=Cloeon dipterum TaxID=197152 RepID=A0A8S1DFH2_9INSE|nr:Hypothetical predicted protein [Cloeon dipterum]
MVANNSDEVLEKYELTILDRAQKLKMDLSYLDFLSTQVKTVRESPTNFSLELKTSKCQNPNGNEAALQKVVLPSCEAMANEIIGPHLHLVDLTGFISFCHPDKKFHTFQDVLLFRHLDLDPLFHQKICFSDLLSSDMLGKMQRIRELQIELFSFKLDEVLNLIFSCRSSLVFVSVNLDLDASVPLPPASELQEKLANLRIFLFRSPSKERVKQLKQLCVRHLPKLQAVQEFASEFCTGQGLPLPDPEESRNKKPPASNLLHLTIDLDTDLRDTKDIHLRFPHVTHLKVFQDKFFPVEVVSNKLDFLLNFCNVEHLDIRMSRPPTFNPILEELFKTYKMKIKTLSVVSLSPSIKTCSISHIFYQCPNLEKLNFVSYQMEVDELRPPINHLTELELLVTHISKDRSDLLSFILRSASLERVKLIGQTENVEDVDNVVCSIQGTRGILRNLKSLVIDMDCASIEQVNDDTFESYSELIKCVDECLKEHRLENVQFFMNKLDEYTTLVRCHLGTCDGPKIRSELFFSGADGEQIDWFVDTDLIAVLDRFSTNY